MKRFLPLILLLVGCTQSETPDIKLDISDESLYKMTRQEVISAISECVDVTCAPSSQKQVLFSPCPNCPLTIGKIQ